MDEIKIIFNGDVDKFKNEINNSPLQRFIKEYHYSRDGFGVQLCKLIVDDTEEDFNRMYYFNNGDAFILKMKDEFIDYIIFKEQL